MEPFIKQIRITDIIRETENAKTFILEPMNGWKPEYKAGQFLTILFSTPFGEKRRSYSFSSSPELKESLSITIKKVDNGEFSRRMLYETKVGAVLNTAGVSGLFCIPEESEHVEQIFFLAAGSGITPCYSMIKTLLHTTEKQVALIYSNKNERDTIFLKPLQALLQQFSSRFQIRFLNSDSEDIFNRRLSNWLLKIIIKQCLKTNKENTLFYLCGPFEYMQMIRISLLTEDITNDQIRKEIFTPLPQLNSPVPPDTEKHTVTIHFNGHQHSLIVQYPKTILAMAKEKNIVLPYSCEAGICGTCTATCVKGKVWMKYNAVLTETELKKGRVLTCQGFAEGGDVELVVD